MLAFAFPDARRRALLSAASGGALATAAAGGALRLAPDAARLADLLLAARCQVLTRDELYFLQSADELRAPLNHRSEAAAASLLLAQLGGADAADGAHAALRAALAAHCAALFPAFGDAAAGAAPATPSAAAPPGSPEAAFQAWAAARGVETALELATFAGGLRGARAARAAAPGACLLSVPRAALIYEATVRETDLGKCLLALPALAADAQHLLIVFAMVDRFDEDSLWAPFWRSLPASFRTGLSFPAPLLAALAGSAAALEAGRGQAHLAAQRAAAEPLFAALLAAYPEHLKPEWFSLENYVWAAELFYSYAFEVSFPSSTGGGGAAAAEAAAAAPGRGQGQGQPLGEAAAEAPPAEEAEESQTVMAPFACHLNHSPWPHVVRYGVLDAATDALRFPAFRPVEAGEQAFISYGPVPNLKLLVYYGFALDDNPHEVVPIALEVRGVVLA